MDLDYSRKDNEKYFCRYQNNVIFLPKITKTLLIMKKILLLLTLALLTCSVFAQDAAFKKEVEKAIELADFEATLTETLRIQYQQLVDAGTIKVDDVDALAHRRLQNALHARRIATDIARPHLRHRSRNSKKIIHLP